MRIIRDVHTLKILRRESSGSLGFVATMGALHEGHRSLIKKSILDNSKTILSIFVNPTQFNDAQDFQHYPRVEDKDFRLAEEWGVDIVFAPSVEEIYPDAKQFFVRTSHPLSQVMEGEFRPGHFDGMLTVVTKLLLIVKADRAYFGEKDFQQLQLVRDLVRAFFIDTEIISCPTLRLDSGLPLSSRNVSLTEEGKILADQFADIFSKSTCENELRHKIQALGMPYDYLQSYEDRLFAAVRIGNLRLIDNKDLK